MATYVIQRGDIEGVTLYQDFDEVLEKMDRAFRNNSMFLILEKGENTKRVAFSLPNVLRVEEL